ncbi:venom prothrombin activator notecarin-D1-like [Xiphias gladius]|uniref:venom prothrombin activator notecarin-D1-like n=1 Tax=Xiphias gladius TaxID=8245 RepID=UPI001A995E92|nr:venom prothrombin activator notecarin-D1-like [Xiphias gladius]
MAVSIMSTCCRASLLSLHLFACFLQVLGQGEVFHQARRAHAVFLRSRRANMFLLEEILPGNLERECIEERCNFEEAREHFEDTERTISFWTSYYNRDQCEPNPCLRGGNCTYTAGGFRCSCAAPHSGPLCEVGGPREEGGGERSPSAVSQRTAPTEIRGAAHTPEAHGAYPRQQVPAAQSPAAAPSRFHTQHPSVAGMAECPTEGPQACHQLCTASDSAFACSCMPGFKLQPDEQSCVPEVEFPCGRLPDDFNTTASMCRRGNCPWQVSSSRPIAARHRLIQMIGDCSPSNHEGRCSRQVCARACLDSLVHWSSCCVFVFRLQVSLRNYSGVELCSGVVLGRHSILTTARCLLLDSESSHRHLNVSTVTGNKIIVPVQAQYIHEHFRLDHHDNDLAFLELARPLPFGPTLIHLCLPTKDFSENILMNSGRTGVTGRRGGGPNQDPVYMTLDECRSQLNVSHPLSNKMFCMRTQNGRGPNSGQSGRQNIQTGAQGTPNGTENQNGSSSSRRENQKPSVSKGGSRSQVGGRPRGGLLPGTPVATTEQGTAFLTGLLISSSAGLDDSGSGSLVFTKLSRYLRWIRPRIEGAEVRMTPQVSQYPETR